MKTTIIKAALIPLSIALMYYMIHHFGGIQNNAIRYLFLSLIVILFTAVPIYIAVRILTAREPRTYTDREFSKDLLRLHLKESNSKPTIFEHGKTRSH